MSYANGCYYHLGAEGHQSSIVCSLWVTRIICHFWVINHIGEFWGLQSADMVCNRDIRPSSPNCHTTLFHIFTPTPPPTKCTMPWCPPICSINKPQAGPRRRIMVHLEVTGKENRALCITNRDRDKHSEALRNLIKDYANMSETGHIFFGALCHKIQTLQLLLRSAEIPMLILCYCVQIKHHSHFTQRPQLVHYTPCAN